MVRRAFVGGSGEDQGRDQASLELCRGQISTAAVVPRCYSPSPGPTHPLGPAWFYTSKRFEQAQWGPPASGGVGMYNNTSFSTTVWSLAGPQHAVDAASALLHALGQPWIGFCRNRKLYLNIVNKMRQQYCNDSDISQKYSHFSNIHLHTEIDIRLEDTIFDSGQVVFSRVPFFRSRLKTIMG